MHVTIDGYQGAPQKLADENLVHRLLDRYPGEIGMTKISEPYVCRYVGAKPEDWGVSGFVLIAESHISIHTFPEHRYVWVDIFSCKAFDATKAIEDMKREFELGDVTVRVLERGLEYPHHVASAIPLALRERQEVAASVGENGG
jgi:S-adenosylmethionine decarboxylase